MARTLRERLAGVAPSAPRPPARAAGIYIAEETRPIPEGFAGLEGASLKRFGVDGAFLAERAAFVDAETTGLHGAGTVAFLVGVGTIRGGGFAVRQFMMRGYADEPELLDAVREAVRGRDLIVSFNGKSFDAPILAGRYAMRREASPLEGARHADLLHIARRAWKHRLDGCDLVSLEERILGFAREGDVDGAEIPARFFEYAKTGDFGGIADVVTHNRLDIFSLGELLVRLHRVYSAPRELTDPIDLYSMGRAMERQGELNDARDCYRLASKVPPQTSAAALRSRRYAEEARLRLSLILKRAGESDAAERIWSEMAARGQRGSAPLIELAKLHEHARKDAEAALRYALRALEAARDPREIAALRHRAERLTRKIERRGEDH